MFPHGLPPKRTARAYNGPHRLSFQTISSPLVQQKGVVPFVSPATVRRVRNNGHRMAHPGLVSPQASSQRVVPFVSPHPVHQVGNNGHKMADPRLVSPPASSPIAPWLADDSVMANMYQSKLMKIVGPNHSLCK